MLHVIITNQSSQLLKSLIEVIIIMIDSRNQSVGTVSYRSSIPKLVGKFNVHSALIAVIARSQMSSTHLSHPPSLLQLQQQMSKSCTDMRARIDTDTTGEIQYQSTKVSLGSQQCKTMAHTRTMLKPTAKFYQNKYKLLFYASIAILNLNTGAVTLLMALQANSQ